MLNKIYFTMRRIYPIFNYIINRICKNVTSPSIKMSHMSTHQQQNLQSKSNRIVWVDLEMTGLDINVDHILEIACLITDADLNIVATGPNIVIQTSEDILKNMSEWCIAHHGESGLIKACLESTTSLAKAEQVIVKFVKAHIPEKKCPLAGNSVYMDRIFLNKYMPYFNNYMHHRIIDVSSIKELAKLWYPKDYSGIPQKSFKHRSLDDIKESIAELVHYKQTIFKMV